MPSEQIKRIVTAHEVARHAGVSQSAVSRTYTPNASVSQKTKDKVLTSAKILGYRPNKLASSLITRKSGIIGVAAGYSDNPFYPALVEELVNRIDAIGSKFLLFNGNPHTESDPILEDILRYQVDALILLSTTLSSRLAANCRAAGIPVVLINRITKNGNSSSVTGDNVVGSRAIAKFLLAGGHKNMAFISGGEGSSTSRERENGFQSALQDAGASPAFCIKGDYHLETARNATRQLLTTRPQTDAIFCANDHMAFAVIEVAKYEFNLDIGREISIVGFDNVDMAAWPSFSLTTYSQPLIPMAEAAMGIITDEDKSPIHKQIPGELIIRTSARLP